MSRPTFRLAILATAGLLASTLAACGTDTASGSSPSSAEPASAGSFPRTLDNCGRSVTIAAAPKRIVLVNNDAVANLEALDAIDRVVGVTAPLQPELYEPETYERLGDLTMLSSKTNSTGGSIVSQESLLAADPDLVIAPANAVDIGGLEAAGIAVYVPTAFCTDPGAALSRRATFDRVWDDLGDYATLLGVEPLRQTVEATAKARVADMDAPDRGTAAALYVSSGGSVLSPYGAPSMVTPVFEAAGLDNVYADQDERVFDVNLEDLVDRDPRTIVLLYSDDPEGTRDAFLSVPGVDALSAVKSGRVVTLPFPYTDPASVLSTRGPEALTKALDDLE